MIFSRERPVYFTEETHPNSTFSYIYCHIWCEPNFSIYQESVLQNKSYATNFNYSISLFTIRLRCEIQMQQRIVHKIKACIRSYRYFDQGAH